MTTQPKERGRPFKYPMPEPIDATPEEIARVTLRAKPKKHWDYEKKYGRKRNKS